MTNEENLSYKEKNKLAWQNISKRWINMTDEERCVIVTRLYHAPTSFIPKDFMHEVYRWVIDGLMFERLEFPSLAEENRKRFKIVLPD